MLINVGETYIIVNLSESDRPYEESTGSQLKLKIFGGPNAGETHDFNN